MNILTMAIADAIAIASLCTLYMVRHRNRELMISYAVINAGIFTVSVALVSAGSNASAMGMGLFGVLSIIRLLSAPPWLLTPPRWAPLPQASSSFAAPLPQAQRQGALPRPRAGCYDLHGTLSEPGLVSGPETETLARIGCSDISGAGYVLCRECGLWGKKQRVQNKTVVPVRRSALIRKIGAVERDIQS
ncbi:DUF4956 domain-containing protein [uncultured Rothia sp.]|uniref:DUF4956 domain-containing protein n=1 Tax=uncultured Rothia sp. TaxID=316088 RepID=UPI00261AC533|nr:DUF4956 domain-containing protein [uncultured Rothia sp.]